MLSCVRLVAGTMWAGVNWLLPVVFHPLERLSISDRNKAALVECGLLPQLMRVFEEGGWG